MTDEDIQRIGGDILVALRETNERLDTIEGKAVTQEQFKPEQRKRKRRDWVLMALALCVLWNGYNTLHQQWADARTKHEQSARRVAFAAQQYAGCEKNNDQNRSIDNGYQAVFGPIFAVSPNPAGLSRTLDALRGGMTVDDCGTFLAQLSTDEAARARKAAAAIPRQPLPPPTIPGYVPPSGPA